MRIIVPGALFAVALFAVASPTGSLAQQAGFAASLRAPRLRAALEHLAGPDGEPSSHPLYVTFRTRAPGVSVPPDLLKKYPDEMTIVLQHQFWNLKPGATGFSVELKFSGVHHRLIIPYQAVAQFEERAAQ